MRRVVWTKAAQEDLKRIRTYIGQFRPLAAQRFAALLVASANGLNEMPERGRSVRAGQRELVVTPPYLIRYRFDDEAVFIVRIRHGARRPD